MQKLVLVSATSAFILTYGVMGATAQVVMPQQQQSHEGAGMRGMMGQGTMGAMGSPGMPNHPAVMGVIFALMDADGDRTISLQEFQAAHERIFKAMDTNKDGRLSLDEMQAFMHGRPRAAPLQ
jgi:hypothetical protein